MFIIIDYLTTIWKEWRIGRDTVKEEQDDILLKYNTTILFANKAFGSREAAKKYIEKYFIGKSESYTIDWKESDASIIDCVVVEKDDIWEDEDGKVGKYIYNLNNLSIQEIDNTVIY